MSAVLSTHSLFGTLMEGIFGYQEAPSVSEVAVWFIYLIPALVAFALPPRAGATARLAPRNKYDANSCLVTTYFKGIVSS